MMRTLLALALWCVLVSSAAAQTVQIRPIDQATVRIYGVSGMEPEAVQARTVYLPKLSHGSGVLITPSLIATAAHVVADLDILLVRFVGDPDIHTGVVVALDEERDVAVVRIAPVQFEPIPLPDPVPSLTPGELLHITGYPVDLREHRPAAASGSLSRATNDGWLELSIPLNPGNSGGPVLNQSGDLIGIVSARGRVDRGIQGIALAAPISSLLGLTRRLSDDQPAALPRRMPWFVDDEATAADEHIGASPVLAALIAHREWRLAVRRMREFRVTIPARLPTAARNEVDVHLRVSRRALEAALEHGSLTERYRLEELRAQLAFGSAATGPGRVLSETAAVQRLEVRVPTPRAPVPVSFRFGIESGGPGIITGARASILLDLLRGERLDLFTAVSVFGGFWLDVCVDCDPNDTPYGGATLEVGARLKLDRFVFEAAYGPSAMYLLDNPYFVYARFRSSMGVRFRSTVLSLDYRFELIDSVEVEPDYSDDTAAVVFNGIGLMLTFQL